MNNPRYLLWTFVLLLATSSLLRAEVVSDTTEAVLARGLHESGWKTKEANLQDRVIAELQAILLDNRVTSDGSARRDNARLALLDLGDGLAIKDTMRLYHLNTNSRRHITGIIQKSEQLLLVPILAQDISKVAESEDHPRASNSSLVICKILINASEIGLDVKRWASYVMTLDRAQWWPEVLTFWEKNAAFFTAKDYAKVTAP
jgi:hypothetical protein